MTHRHDGAGHSWWSSLLITLMIHSFQRAFDVPMKCIWKHRSKSLLLNTDGHRTISLRKIFLPLKESQCTYMTIYLQRLCCVPLVCSQSLATWETENKITCRQTLVDGNGPRTYWTRELRGNELILVRTSFFLSHLSGIKRKQ